jgi:hypothetical protein
MSLADCRAEKSTVMVPGCLRRAGYVRARAATGHAWDFYQPPSCTDVEIGDRYDVSAHSILRKISIGTRVSPLVAGTFLTPALRAILAPEAFPRLTPWRYTSSPVGGKRQKNSRNW